MKIKLPWSKPKPTHQEMNDAVAKAWVDTDEGWLNTNWDLGWWQQDRKPRNGGMNEAVEACISALSQTVSMCPAHLYKESDDGELERQRGSYVEKVLLNPNAYTSRTLFFNTIIRCMYFSGNGYAVATRDGNGSVKTLHVVDPRNTNGVIDPESGEVFYWTSPNANTTYNAETDTVYPARDVLNLRINVSDRDPLKGETPVTVAARSIAANSAITGHQASFFSNMSRPSGLIHTDEKLNADQMNQLREAIHKQTQQESSGGVPVLGYGLKWQSMSLTSQDAQMVEAFGMTLGSISRALRVPLAVINDMSNSTFNNAAALNQWFLSSGLGFLFEHIELELNRLFGLPFDQRINFDTRALLRSDFKTQIDTLGSGVINGIYSPNEARQKLGMGPVESGDEPRVQQQVVPLSAWDKEPVEPPQPVMDEEEAKSAILKGMANVRAS